MIHLKKMLLSSRYQRLLTAENFWFGLALVTFFSDVVLSSGIALEEYRSNFPVALHAFLFVSVQLIAAGSLILRRNIREYIRIRVFVDHVFVLATTLFPYHLPMAFVLYLIVCWAHIAVNLHLFNADSRIAVFLMVSNVCAFATGARQLGTIPNFYIYNVSIALTALIGAYLWAARNSEIQKSRIRAEMESIRCLELGLLRHNVVNCANNLLGNLEMKKELGLRNLAEKSLYMVVDYLDQLSGSKSSKTALREVALAAIRHFRGMATVRLIFKESNPSVAQVPFRSILYPVVVAVENAIEAGATVVSIEVTGSSIAVIDNGPGFDPGEIRSGISSKKHGHGYGLRSAQELCRLNGIAMQIESKIGSGTKVLLNVGNLSSPVNKQELSGEMGEDDIQTNGSNDNRRT